MMPEWSELLRKAEQFRRLARVTTDEGLSHRLLTAASEFEAQLELLIAEQKRKTTG
jgi:hypothetical protein